MLLAGKEASASEGIERGVGVAARDEDAFARAVEFRAEAVGKQALHGGGIGAEIDEETPADDSFEDGETRHGGKYPAGKLGRQGD